MRPEAENAVLRHQLIVLTRRLHGRARLTNNDRWFLIQLYRWVPSILEVLTIIQPETVVRWHRAGFRCCWRWKSQRRGGRPQIETELRGLIRRMSMENPLWGAPRIHGELLKLGFSVAQSSVAKMQVSSNACIFTLSGRLQGVCEQAKPASSSVAAQFQQIAPSGASRLRGT